MKRALRFLAWRAEQWKVRGGAREQAGETDGRYIGGLKAYASRQAALCLGLKRLFAQQWSGVEDMVKKARQECESPELYYTRKQSEMKSQSTNDTEHDALIENSERGTA